MPAVSSEAASPSASRPAASEGVRGRGRHIECLQVRLSPVVAHAVVVASAELGETVAALDDLWGRDAVRTQEQLRAAAPAAPAAW